MNSYFCYICFQQTEENFVCDTCDEHYCEDCSYTFTLHYQHEGPRCFHCSEQSRLKPLTKQMIRDNKLKAICNG